jgi:hypothetical protein
MIQKNNFNPEDRGSLFPQNYVIYLQDYMMSQYRRLQCEQSPGQNLKTQIEIAVQTI